MNKEKLFEVIKNRKYQWIAVAIIFAIILIWSSSIRLSNLDLLVDQTSGKNIPVALDPFYFLRVSETIVANNGILPEIDILRYPSAEVGFFQEILPQVVVFMWKFSNVFGEFSLQYINVISPVIFFAAGLIIFFFLIYVLTKSKGTALLGSAFLAFVPAYLYRTMAGFSDHEAMGMLAFFLTMLVFTFGLKYLNKNTLTYAKTGLFGLGVGFLTAFTLASWGGILKFVILVISLSFFIFWILNSRQKPKNLTKYILFLILWIFFSFIFSMFFGFDFSQIFFHFTNSSGLLSLFALVFVLVDYFLIKNIEKISSLKNNLREIYSLVITFLIGIVGLIFLGKGPISLISNIWETLLQPFGGGRTGLTVAENAQPYLLDWISQTGAILFWLFFGGIILIGYEFIKKIKSRKHQFYFVLLWTLMISGILFSRISESSLFNGTGFISQVFYILGVLLFWIYFFYILLKNELKLNVLSLILLVWAFFTVISGRAAIRIFFFVTPFVCFSAGYFIVKIFSYFKRSKGDILKIIFISILILSLVLATYGLYGFTLSATLQAKSTGPSAGYQWQQAMSWVRENTPEESIFVHWWDYGYWVQYLGERATVTDGGHQVGFWDHLIGRYVLTTSKPETALSFMKTHDVSYLLIDPTDLGKYSAYSKIGSGKEGEDRFSWIPLMLEDPKQTQETSNGKMIVYSGGTPVDEDIIYTEGGSNIFLPKGKAALGGVVVEIQENSSFSQPKAVFFYNNKQIIIPIRYLFVEEKLTDFGGGLDAGISIIPSLSQSDQGLQINPLGSLIYMTSKTFDGLFAQLYLMNDPLNKYSTFKLSHSESDPIIGSINAQGAGLPEIVYFQGFRGPIKIWEVDYPSNTLEREEFLRTSGEYAEFDALEFTR
jgi:asparagine N-glycosylation enzyme membrane subunit Stt3